MGESQGPPPSGPTRCVGAKCGERTLPHSLALTRWARPPFCVVFIDRFGWAVRWGCEENACWTPRPETWTIVFVIVLIQASVLLPASPSVRSTCFLHYLHRVYLLLHSPSRYWDECNINTKYISSATALLVNAVNFFPHFKILDQEILCLIFSAVITFLHRGWCLKEPWWNECQSLLLPSS
jgi:hypothetical protein